MTLISKDKSNMYRSADGEIELASRRTRSFKTFKKGEHRRIAGQIGPIHYRQDPFDNQEGFKEIDLDIVATPSAPWDYAMNDNGYQAKFWNHQLVDGKSVYYIAQFRRAGQWIAMAPLALAWENDAGERQLISKPIAGITPTIDNDAYHITWPNCFGPGIHYRYNIDSEKFFKTVIIDDKADLPIPTIGSVGLKLSIVLGTSWHNQAKSSNEFAHNINIDELPADIENIFIDEELDDPDTFSYQDELFRDTFWMQKPKAWDSENHEIDMNWRLQRRGNKISTVLSTTIDILDKSVIYPVYMDVAITEIPVIASLDDGYTFGGAYGSRRTALTARLNRSSVTSLFSLFRFQAVPIPNGVTIDSASVDFFGAGSPAGDDTDVDLYCEDIDDSPDLADANPIIDVRNLTTATVNWQQDNLGIPPPSVRWFGPDISALIKEVIDRPGWSSGNALSLIGVDNQSARDAVVLTADFGAGLVPLFNASYTIVAAGQIMHIY